MMEVVRPSPDRVASGSIHLFAEPVQNDKDSSAEPATETLQIQESKEEPQNTEPIETEDIQKPESQNEDVQEPENQVENNVEENSNVEQMPEHS